MRRIVAAVGLLALAAYALSGWTVVQPGESVVVRRFGKALPEPWGPGPHWGAPYGIDARERVRLDEVRTIEVGRSGVAGLGEDPGSGEFLTADGNLVQARAAVQYRIDDPLAYLTSARDTPAILARLAESDLAASIARSTIDDALAAGGAAVSAEAEARLRSDADAQRLGLAILGVRLTYLRPPGEVQADFDAAQSERSRADRARIEAESRARVLESEARAAASARETAALAKADRAVSTASAKADRFEALLEEARRDRQLTARRLYRDALRDLMPKVGRKVVVGDDEPVDLSVLGIDGPPGRP
ncbi:MAG: SPFH domain-containing protein [Isosphaeraceae bacterium]